ncbi:hypothetical protein J9B83_04600 [Marinomonas sp. A79]|uniref:HTH luxR-type domain-containing protein n=1 Tax=Marinomonas vulgaris TaxID=2823372 RepID=A0ABS5H9D7_9GAMM|nr:hypothetical protein [Marinomonas vulgaris]MBR7888215.1 hypothetical protein [Marinomonas vulgaris]
MTVLSQSNTDSILSTLLNQEPHAEESFAQEPLVQEPQIIQSLYAALVDKEGFHPFLNLIVEAIQGCAAELVVIKKQPLQIDHIWYTGLSEEFMLWYIENDMIKSDLVSNYATYTRPGLFQTALSLIEKAKQLPDYGRWQQDQNMIDSAWLVIDSTDSHTTLLAIQRTVEQGAYQAAELNQLNRLAPYIKQAVLLYQQLDKTQTQTESFSSLVKALPYPSFVLNEQAELMYLNGKAEDFLCRQDQLMLNSKRLEFQDEEHQASYLASSTQIIRASMGQSEFDCDVIVMRINDHKPHLLALTPIDNSGILITVYDGNQRTLPTAELIASYFGFSHAESVLCADLVLGMSLKDIAVKRFKSEATVRSQLKQMFPKAGVHRQGQLICTVLKALMR